MNHALNGPFPKVDWKQVSNIALVVALLLPLMTLSLQPSVCEPAAYSPPPLNWTSANWCSANWGSDSWASHQPILWPPAHLERNGGSFRTAPDLTGERFCAQ